MKKPAKRPRRRPKRFDDGASTTVASTSTNDNVKVDNVLPPTKRSRGRPKKSTKKDPETNIDLSSQGTGVAQNDPETGDTQMIQDESKKDDNSNALNKSMSNTDPCPVCFEVPLHPFSLPCNHVYCFLCAKGLSENTASLGDSKCSMCRQPFDKSIFKNQILLNQQEGQEKVFSWFYEGKNGWWKFDTRSDDDMEAAFKGNQEKIQMLLCGNLYVIDFKNLIQYRQDGSGRIRRIKRDVSNAFAKGTAGLTQS